MQRALGHCMHYLHGYFAVFNPLPALTECPVRHSLLLAAVLGLAFKVMTQEFVLEHLTIRELLALFEH